MLCACSGNYDEDKRVPAKCVQQLGVDDALRNGGISYAIQVLIAYCRVRAGLLVVLVGDFSSDQDLPFI